MTMTIILPLIIAGAAVLWLTSQRAPKGILIVLGIILHGTGRLITGAFPQTIGLHGEKLGSFAYNVLADVSLPLQILGTVAVIHGLYLIFRKKQRSSQPAI